MASRKGGLAILVIIIEIAVNYLLLATRSALTPIEQAERVWPITAVPAKHGDVQPEIGLFGEVVAGLDAPLASAGQVLGAGALACSE